LTSEKTFKHVNNWIQSIYKLKDHDIPIVLVANKSDLLDERVVTHD